MEGRGHSDRAQGAAEWGVCVPLYCNAVGVADLLLELGHRVARLHLCSEARAAAYRFVKTPELCRRMCRMRERGEEVEGQRKQREEKARERGGEVGRRRKQREERREREREERERQRQRGLG